MGHKRPRRKGNQGQLGDLLIDAARGSESADERFARTGGLGRALSPRDADPELEAERRAFYISHPFAELERAMEQRRPSAFARALGWLAGPGRLLRSLPVPLRGALLGAAASMMAMAILLPLLREGDKTEMRPGVERLKGTALPGARPGDVEVTDADVSVGFFVLRKDAPQRGFDGGTYHRDDRIRLTYSSGDLAFAFVFGIDELGAITQYYPESGDESIAIVPGRDLPLPGSIILDDYVGLERFVTIFSSKPLASAAVSRAATEAYSLARRRGGLREMGRLELEGTAQASFVIRKVAD